MLSNILDWSARNRFLVLLATLADDRGGSGRGIGPRLILSNAQKSADPNPPTRCCER